MPTELSKKIIGEFLSSCDQSLLSDVRNPPDPQNLQPNNVVRFLPIGSTKRTPMPTQAVRAFLAEHEVGARGHRQLEMSISQIEKLQNDPEWDFSLKPRLDVLSERKSGR